MVESYTDKLNIFAHKLRQKLASEHPEEGEIRVHINHYSGKTRHRVSIWTDQSQERVYCFVRIEDGTLLRATSWSGSKAPPEGLDRTIYDDDCGIAVCSLVGVRYK